MALAIYAVVLCVASLPWSSAFNWCKLECTGSVRHTMCVYPKGGGAVCKHGQHKLTAKEKKAILHQHNDLRMKVATGQETRGSSGAQPPAADMMKLEWDNQLEEIAQRWADQCETDDHDKCRITRDRQNVGQNIYAARDMEPPARLKDIQNGIKAWYDEVVKFDNTNIDPFLPDLALIGYIGHYTQVAWASTRKLGCGYSSVLVGEWYRTKLVCNYQTPGNFLEQTMYTRGTPASKCPPGTIPSQTYEGLCEVHRSFLEKLLTLPGMIVDFIRSIF